MSAGAIFSRPIVRNSTLVLLMLLFAAGAGASYLKLHFLGTTHSGDYDTYIETARYLGGEDVDAPPLHIPQRLLKPLFPALLLFLSQFTNFYSAAVIQTVFFYLLLIVALFLLGREFFEDDILATLFVLLTAGSYPVLKYGLDVYSENGAWFFYVFSLYLTLRFLKNPSSAAFLSNVLTITIGFLWKEYIIVAAAVFGLVILFHSMLTLRSKIIYVFLYAGIFLAVHIPWQLYVFRLFEFSYLDWYRIGGASGFSYEFTLKNIVKSTAALLGIFWLLVPHGFLRLRTLERPKRMFSYIATPLPLIAYAWGFISSRLLYVIAPPMLLVAMHSMRLWRRRYQIALVALALFLNVGWLILSYRISI